MARRHQDVADGDHCPVDPEHGRMLTIRSDGPNPRQYCPHEGHHTPGAMTPAIYKYDGITPVQREARA